MSTFKDVVIENSITAGTVESPIIPAEDNELATKNMQIMYQHIIL